VPIASYDPVFWAHHAMIDRLWYLWQISPHGTSPGADLLGQVLAPWPVTVSKVLDISTLGYEYAAQVIG
jgi:tyrosinase